ncbi:MAG: PEP-CTERM sorting domain-containing protein [Gemmataceae bacterium]
MSLRKSLCGLALLGSLCAIGYSPPAAQAGIIPTGLTVTPNGGNYTYSYTFEIQSGTTVWPGSFFIIYDFQGYVPGTVVLPGVGWSLDDTVSFTGPITYFQGSVSQTLDPFDDPSIVNLRFNFDAPGNWPPLDGPLTITVAVDSTLPFTGGQASFSAFHRRTSDTLKDGNVTFIDVPGQIQHAPEPTTLVLLGAGLPLLGAFGVYRRRKAAATV